jgi:hypothetical protein
LIGIYTISSFKWEILYMVLSLWSVRMVESRRRFHGQRLDSPTGTGNGWRMWEISWRWVMVMFILFYQLTCCCLGF